MKKKLTEDEKQKILKMLDQPDIKSKISDPQIGKTNKEAQSALKKIPDVKTDGVAGVLDWLEDYLNILQSKN